jgi:hypothetical protein
MKKYVSLQPQREKIYELIKDIAKSRSKIIALSEENSDVSCSYECNLVACEDRLTACLGDLGDMIGFTIMSDVIENEEVEL